MAAENDPAIIQMNIERFQQLLATELDGVTRQAVERLLAEARADLRKATGQRQGVRSE